ncbi:acyl-CoA dehydrogenase family protein [Nocardia miyunensis]|uniref:acyl-CoA dehydrogenase family protein n=1 Tax=Nocardia miyunensis TaxID=282684 RepID=UPI0008295EA3|nr:acyl-CoA dehydrogenase family protein [Nocardia miyunensis]
MGTSTDTLTLADLRSLREAVRSFLVGAATQDSVRTAMAAGVFDRSIWTTLETELGVLSVLGDRAALPALGVVAEELGRVVFPGPFLGGAAAAAQACLHHPDPARGSELLDGIGSGAVIAATCLDERSVNGLRLVPGAGGWTVTGDVAAVVDAPIADIAVLAVRGDEGLVVVAVELSGDHAEMTVLPVLDQTRTHGDLAFSGARAEILVGAEHAASFVRAADAQARALLAAEQVGGSDVVLGMAVDYAKTRKQFGRAIGSFQAIKHRCTDMYVKVQGARSLAEVAIELATRPETELDPRILAAYSYCTESYLAVAEANIQIHGGIGFTWEHPAHLYLKRARGSGVLLGSPLGARALLMDRLRSA